MRQTTMANAATIERKWYVVDAAGQTLGRLASEVATVLRGKNKPTYTPHVMTGKKLENTKYYRHSGWLGGLKVKTAKQFLEQNPTGFVEAAVKGMLPHNTLGRKQGMKLFVYAGDKHPHAAQNPVEMKVKG